MVANPADDPHDSSPLPCPWVPMRFAQSLDVEAMPPGPLALVTSSDTPNEATAFPPLSSSSSSSRGAADELPVAGDLDRRRPSSSTQVSDSVTLSNVSLNVFSSPDTDPASSAMLLLPSDGGGDATAMASSASLPRPLSAADKHLPVSSPLLSHFPRSGSVSPARSMSSFATQRTDDADATRPTLHGAAAGAHAAGDQRTQLYVRNLPPHVRWQDLKDLFRRAGTVLRADVHASPFGLRHIVSGTVLFATETDAHHAINTLHGYNWHGHVLEVGLDEHIAGRIDGSRRLSRPHAGGDARHGLGFSHASAPPVPLPYPGRVLFVGNLPFHCQWQDLKDLFRAAGNILRADVALNEDGRSRGFGTVLFASPEDAQTAVRLYHGYEYSGRILKVHFDRHTPCGPASFMVPTDPSQYTSAFHTRRMAPSAPVLPPMPAPVLSPFPPQPHVMPDMAHMAPMQEPASPWTHAAAPRPADAPRSSHPAPYPHPGRIALPPVSFPMMGAMTPGVPLTPGMPGFMMRPALETPPVYPYLMSPGLAIHAPGVSSGFNPYLNTTPGAPVDMHHAMAMAQPASPLPPTPHWSQPVRQRTRAPSTSKPSALQDAPPVSPSAQVSPTSAAPTEGGEYPFPGTTATVEPAPSQALPKDDSPVLSSTRELTSAIAKMSVRGTARAKRTSAHLDKSTPEDAASTEERATAEAALSRLRQDLAMKDKGQPLHLATDA